MDNDVYEYIKTVVKYLYKDDELLNFLLRCSDNFLIFQIKIYKVLGHPAALVLGLRSSQSY